MTFFGKKRNKSSIRKTISERPTISKQKQKAAIISYYIKKREEEKKP